MVPHEVIRIIGNARKVVWKMDHVVVEYWSVPVILECDNLQHESAVTFESLEKAIKLKIGDVFMR